jgi:DNA-binding NarL/FixJ family response regulator
MQARRSTRESKTFPLMRRVRAIKKRSRVLLADREGVFCFGLKKLFGVEDDLRVVAEADNLAQALSLAKAFRPQLLFVEDAILGEDPQDSLTQLHKVSPKGRIVVTASRLREDDEFRFVKAGASGVIQKAVDPALFVRCARRVLDNELWLSKRPAIQKARPAQGTAERSVRPADTLTRREKAIIGCLMQGWRNKEIGDQLTITEQTVKNHLRTIFDKVGVSDRLELVLYAIHQRLDLPPVEPAA